MDVVSYIQHMVYLASEGKLQGIWFWASSYAFVVCFYSFYFQIQTRFWASTVGDLHRIGIEKFGNTNDYSEQQYQGKAQHSYTVNGKPYQGKRISPWIFVTNHNARRLLIAQQAGIDMPSQNRVIVYYNPKKPEKSYLLKANKLGIVITLCTAIAPFLSYIVKFYA